MAHNITEQDILDYMNRADYHPLKRRSLSRAMGVSKARYRDFVNILENLMDRGLVVMEKGRLYKQAGQGTPPSEDQHGRSSSRDVTGTLSVNPAGFGFVCVPEGEDLFIPPGELDGALDGDTVRAEITPSKRATGRGPAGTVVEIVERGRHEVTGIFYSLDEGKKTSGKGGFVLSEHPALSDGVEIAPRATRNAGMGDKVRVKITSWAARNRPASGEISEVYGQAGDWQAELASILDEFSLRVRFPDAALKEADEAVQAHIDAESLSRKDLRHLTTITIDPEDAQDFDDAVSLVPTEEGQRLYVHIADVAFFVREGSQVDREARLRSTSAYLPGQVLSMLPPSLTRDVCCLRPEVDRLALTVALDFAPSGRRTGYSIMKSVIHSDKRLTYERVRNALEGDTPEDLPPNILSLLRDLRSLAGKLRRGRMKAGSIDLDLPEPHIEFHDDGRIRSISLKTSDFAYQMIEDFMLSANRAVAEYCARRRLPAIYRVHDEPDVSDMKKLTEFLAQYDIKLASPYSKKKLQKILDETSDKPYAHAIQMMMLRSLKRAVYSDTLRPHYALGFQRYLHFTSPIRRYPDLVVHRFLHRAMGSGAIELKDRDKPPSRPKVDRSDLRHLALHCSERERAAAAAEDRLTRFRQIEFLRERMDQEFNGVVVAAGKYGLRVEIEDVWVGGTLGVADLEGEGFRFHKAEHMLVGKKSGQRIRLGEKMKVRVKRADLITGEVDLVPAETRRTRSPKGRQKRR